jgi:hypothetical protein
LKGWGSWFGLSPVWKEIMNPPFRSSNSCINSIVCLPHICPSHLSSLTLGHVGLQHIPCWLSTLSCWFPKRASISCSRCASHCSVSEGCLMGPSISVCHIFPAEVSIVGTCATVALVHIASRMT